MLDSSRTGSLIFRSSLFLLCLTIQSAGWSSPQRPNSNKSVRPIAHPGKKKSKSDQVRSDKRSASLLERQQPKAKLPAVAAPLEEPSEPSGSAAPEALLPPPPVVEEADEVKWMFPNRQIAHIEEDPNFRLLVTVDGTTLQKETDGNYRLTKGSILICPAKKTTLYSPHCSIELKEGSVVTIDASSAATYIRDFHDRWKGHVVVRVESKTLYLMPGMELVITSETDSTKAWQTAIKHPIRRRDLAQTFSSPSIVVYEGEFSILDAMLKSEQFRLLKTSSDAGDVIDEVTKTAALLHITDHKGPYIIMLP